jgi:predicted metal-dependent peptidase
MEDEFTIKPVGGGGTAFSPVFKFIEDKDLNPMACVFLTDLYCGDFGNTPHYPVLWATIGDEKAPFGEVLSIKEN